MRPVRAWLLRIGGMFGKRRRDRELAAELESHLQMHIEENLRAGMTPEEARRQALIRLGGVEQTKEKYRDRHGLPWLETLLQDARFGLRMLGKNPGFSAVAVLTLALGIGANTAIFSLIDAVLLRSLPVAHASQLVQLRWGARNPPKIRFYGAWGDCASEAHFWAANPASLSGCSFSEPMFREIARANLFSGVTAFADAGRLNVAGNGEASVIDGQLVSGGFFSTLGVKAAAGRVIEPGDDSPAAPAVAVLSYGYWQSAFGGASSVVGRTMRLNNAPFTIVGVVEQKFDGVSPGSAYQVWLPLTDAQRISNAALWRNRQNDVTQWWLTIVGRLKADKPQAEAEVNSLFRNEMLHGSVPMFDAGSGPRQGKAPESSKGQAQSETLSTPADDPTVTLLQAQTGLAGSRGLFADPLYVLMFTVGVILLIACANVAGLLLARGAARQREMAVRLALGASRMRIVWLLLTESVMLSALGGLLGILFASWGAQAILSFVSRNQPRALGFAASPDARVLAFAIGVSLISGILFGLAPAFRNARIDLNPTLKQGEGGSASGRNAARGWFGAGNALVVAQVAMAIVVLVGAGLLVRTLANLRSIDVGFDAHNLINFTVDPTLVGYKSAEVDSFYRDLQGRLAETPGVQAASYSMVPLLSNGLMNTAFPWPDSPQKRRAEADVLPVGPSFFKTMRIAFLAGREFSTSDYVLAASNSHPWGTPPSSSVSPSARLTSAPTPAIVNQMFVEKYLDKGNPLGKRFGESRPDEHGPRNSGYVVIGVVRDTKYNSLRREIQPMLYTPQNGSGATFEVRTAADPRALLPAIREVVAQINANLPLFEVTTESEQIDRLLFEERLVARLSSFFGVLALVLACVGLYGLLSYEVARRTREIGIRVALGAQQGDVMRLVMKQGMALGLVGATVGVGVALGVTRYLTSMLYGVSAFDPVTIVAVAGILALVVLAACYIPARRAMRVDPMVALRYE